MDKFLVLSRFSYLKSGLICGFMVLMPLLLLIFLPSLGSYVGNRYPTEMGKVLYYIPLVGFIALLPLPLIHIWNIIRDPAAIYLQNEKLYIYTLGHKSIPIGCISGVMDEGPAGPLGHRMKIVMNSGETLLFQTHFMEASPAALVTQIEDILRTDTLSRRRAAD